jgi:hypothetical protein
MINIGYFLQRITLVQNLAQSSCELFLVHKLRTNRVQFILRRNKCLPSRAKAAD